MTPHNNAKLGDYAPIVLMPGDPKRATFIAGTFLSNVKKVNTVRNCFGYTGIYKDKLISVQASGMGQPSMGIYATELFEQYGVEKIIRVGTCGALVPTLQNGDCVVAISAATDSSITRVLPRFTLAPHCSYQLLSSFVNTARLANLNCIVGQMTSNDQYYHEVPNWASTLASKGVIAVDMETHYLYYLANSKGKQALSVNMVSDSLLHKEQLTPEQKETQIQTIAATILDSL